jgi:hypothetical protein
MEKNALVFGLPKTLIALFVLESVHITKTTQNGYTR